MTHEEFEELINERLEKSREMILKKNGAYTRGQDSALYSFEEAARMDGITPEQALWDYARKHLVSVKGLIDSDSYVPHEVIEEKCGDIVNYFIILEAMMKRTKYSELPVANTIYINNE